MLHDQVVTPLAGSKWERRKSRGASPSSQRSVSTSSSGGVSVGKGSAKSSDLQATAVAWRQGNGKPKASAGSSPVASNKTAGRRKPSPSASASPVHLPVWLTEEADYNDASVPIADR